MDRDPQPSQDSGEVVPHPGKTSEQGTELTDLKDQFEQQQVLIAQLKEMLRKTDQTNVSQEKVDRYASTLSKMTIRAKKSKLKKESSAGSSESSGAKSGAETPVNEKISLLRRQLEENKVKIAERGKNQKGIEEMVIQLKAQFDDSLQLIHDTSSNFSLFDTKIDYSKESSSEELYNVLVIKEKKITDLNCKVQKLEATVLDLQENIKEKDCVIDARTKAITLMTESLSKKGKNTLDALDETKEQMRKMQEDFVKLENEMKARQMKLLDDLRLKNLEIAELQEINENSKNQHEERTGNNEAINALKKELENILDKMQNVEALNNNLSKRNEELEEANNEMKKDCENRLELSKTEADKYQQKITELENNLEQLKDLGKVEVQSEETTNAQKDLDDLNKNMIKIKAEHKKKIKILNKKIDNFKKIGDVNAHIVKLTEENDTLKEKIAELEEEKGNYQLKMIDSFSKDSPRENVEELQEKIKELSSALEEQSSKLAELQSENTSLKKDVESSNEKLIKLSDLQNEKVTSEITSIQLEELSEKLLREKSEIISAKETLQNELLDKIETLNRDKLEIQSKLDQYIHENMELIDKLEKLSAEKVSSAESIEMVENLTHQEKLELEEYQKNLDPQSGKLKISEEHLEGTPDLNDSVNQLNEETSELLQKIELFTVERREVMEKMESLTSENSQLNIKLKQIENNRDLLTETYEQLQSEKEELDNRIENLQKENNQLKESIELMKNEYNIKENEVLNKKLSDLQNDYVKLSEENKNLHKELKLTAEIIHEKDNLESELEKARNKVKELEKKLAEDLEEIDIYQSVIEDNKAEFIRSASQLNELKGIINSKEIEIKEYKEEIDNLNETIKDFSKTIDNLETENKTNKENISKIEFLEEQLESLKIALNDNLGQIGDYEKELEENSDIMKQLNQQLKVLSNKNLELQNILDGKNEEQTKTIAKLNVEIEELKARIITKDEMFHKVSNEMKDKYILLQKQTDSNTESLEDIREPLQKKIEELTSKNNILVEKMKKIAANLKKKTQICQDLELQLHSNQEKWETELNEKNIHINETELKMEKLRIEAEMYQTEVKQLQQILDKKVLKDVPQGHALEVRSEMSLQEELSGSSIVPESGYKSFNDSTFSKIQELELIIETQENDITNYKDRISALEEMLAKIDERRETLEQKTNELGVQLQEKSQSFEEISKTEDLLEEKLKHLSKYNEEVQRKLEEVSRENESLLSENGILKDSSEKLKHKLSVAQERVNELLEFQQNAALLEQDLEKSRNQINILEQEVRKLEVEKVQFAEFARSDLEKLDTDWQIQFETISKEKSELSIFCEKLHEKISELEESERVLVERAKELELKLEKTYELQSTSDLELTAQRGEIEKLTLVLELKNGEIESRITELRNLETEVNNLKHENDKLKIHSDESVNELKNLLHQANDELSQIKLINDELRNKPQAKENVEEPIKSQSLFAWPDEQEDPFNFVKIEQQTQPIGERQENKIIPKEPILEENTREELLQKIKTLAFMLNNVENERDEVLNQCSHLSNELMKIVYEKESQQNVEKETSTDGNLKPADEPLCVKKQTYLCYPDDAEIGPIESQVLSEEFIKETEESRAKLRQIEFTKAKDIVDNMVPSDEDPCHKKEAYLCYPKDKLDVECQMLPTDYFKETKESLEVLRSLEFGETKEFVEHHHPVQEAPCEKKEAYLCQPDQINLDTFGEDDDGWGWNPEEARLEEQHNKDHETSSLQIKIATLEDKIKVMEIERENKSKEYQELQVKSGKLIKKFKELKIKNDQLQHGRKHENDDMFSLENAIQEELKIQVQTLEKRIVEVGNELSKEKNEKLDLQKKIGALSLTSQRMSEMKEKQDIELLMWQRKTEELKSKLDQFEWGISADSPEKTKKTSQELNKITEIDIVKMENTIAELNETIKELTLDNEDLQALLEEQRTLRINAERSKSIEPVISNMKTEIEYMEIVNQKQTLENELSNITSEKKRLQNELNQIIKRNDEQLEEFRKVYEEKTHLEKVIVERDEIVKKLSINLEQVQIENDKLEKLLADKSQCELQVQGLLQKIHDLEENQDKGNSEQTVNLCNEKEALVKELQEKSIVVEVLLQDKEKLLHDLNEKDVEIHNFEKSIEEKTTSLKNELEDQMKNTERIMQENENLCMQKRELEEQIQLLLQQFETKTAEFDTQVEKLNQDWQIIVDQRGSDVAESWKLHLESRETEFGQIQEKLRREVNDLEEKCNSLVNENNELRKNVDAEIRNEVDRISALQQQINERQQSINELSQTIAEKDLQLENANQNIQQLQSTVSNLQIKVEENEVKIHELNIIVEATQKQFDEKRILVEGIVKVLEERSDSVILFDLESIREELERQLVKSVNQDELLRLQKDISDKDSVIANTQNELASKLDEIKESRRSIEDYISIIEKLKKQLESSEGKVDELSKQLTEKETSLHDIQNELEAKLEELRSYWRTIEEYKLTFVENEKQLTDFKNNLLQKDETIGNLTYRLQEIQGLKENENENVQNLQYSLQQYQLQYDELRSNYSEKTSLFDALNEELQKQHKIHSEREAEVNNLKTYVEELQKSHEFDKDQLEKDKNEIINTQSHEIDVLRNQLSQTQLYTDEIRSEKEILQDSVNYLQSQLQEQIKNVDELNKQIHSCRNLNDQLTLQLSEQLQRNDEEQNVLDVEGKQMAELEAIIEDQVLKIEDLKRKLYEKSNDYDSLIAEMDVRKDDLTVGAQGGSARAPMGRGQLIGPSCEDDLNEWVSRPELDIALYMLHQRDVRCEELTVELTQLLEERDTLQLRLSNALREKEEYKKVALEGGNVMDVSKSSHEGSPSKGAIPKGRVSEIILKSSGTELATEAQETSARESENKLEHKLSELKNIGYKRDKTLLDEQQQRRLQQMSIMQQHMDDAARLPPEAAARLVDANYTLSRDVQSPSKVLLNWLWGKSTPKVNEL